MMEHRDLKTEEMHLSSILARPVWSHSYTCWEDQNTLWILHTQDQSQIPCGLPCSMSSCRRPGWPKKLEHFRKSSYCPQLISYFPKSSQGCAAQIHLLLDPFKKLQLWEKGAELFYKALSFICNYLGFCCTTEYNRSLNWASSIVPIHLFNRAFLLLFPYWPFPFCYT